MATDVQRATRRASGNRRGFTLIEALVVIIVISILMGVSLTVSSRVLAGGRHRATEHVLRAVDSIITEYAASTGGKIPAFYTSPSGDSFPLADGLVNGLPQPSLSLFLLEAAKVPSCQKMIEAIDGEFIRQEFVLATGWFGASTAPSLIPMQAPSIVDGYGRPVRLVHPAFHGGSGPWVKDNGGDGEVQNRPTIGINAPVTPTRPSGGANGVPLLRSVNTVTFTGIGTADEGRCIANRPYVYSAGIDGNPGTRVDNIYLPTQRPQFQNETADIFVR